MINTVFQAPTLSDALPGILNSLLEEGHTVDSRNGKTQEILMARVHLSDPHQNPYSTNLGRKASLPAQIAETVWLLSGRNDIKFIEPFLPRAKDFSDDGVTWRGAYGPRIRNWGGVDQLRNVVDALNLDQGSRRAVINIFDPAVDFQETKDVPCNNWLSFAVRNGKLHTHVAVRSNDAFWGLSGINAFEWTFLSQVVAFLTKTHPGSLTFSTTSLHLYEHHWDRARRVVRAAESDEMDSSNQSQVLEHRNPILVPHPKARWAEFHRGLRLLETFLQSNLDANALVDALTNQPFALFAEWAKAVHDWAHDEKELENSSMDMNLLTALERSPRKRRAKEEPAINDNFTQFIDLLHREKNNVYGDSWRRRGEMLGILANIARKVDRLGKPGAGDNELDTTVDLLLYLVKYQLWLEVQSGYVDDNHLDGNNHHLSVMRRVRQEATHRYETRDKSLDGSENATRGELAEMFESLATKVERGAKNKEKHHLVQSMVDRAYRLAKAAHLRALLEKKQFTGYDV